METHCFIWSHLRCVSKGFCVLCSLPQALFIPAKQSIPDFLSMPYFEKTLVFLILLETGLHFPTKCAKTTVNTSKIKPLGVPWAALGPGLGQREIWVGPGGENEPKSKDVRSGIGGWEFSRGSGGSRRTGSRPAAWSLPSTRAQSQDDGS